MRASHAESPVALAVLGLGAFTVGTSELVVVGILDQIADEAGVSITTAGTLVTAYALGIALGGPLLTALTGHVDRRPMLRIALAVDRSASGTLIAANAGLALALAALYLVGPRPVLGLVALVGWGLVGFGLVSTALQLRVISLAGPGGDLAASLGASAANAGIAAGALVGGQVVAHLGVREVALVGALILLLALPATVGARSLRRANFEEDELVTEPGLERPQAASQVATGP